jgi:hypothetical protein
MSLEDLSDIHTRDDTKRIQDDIYWVTVSCMGHIFWWDDTSDDTLVTVSTSHLITDFDFSSLSNIDFYLLENTCCEVVPFFFSENLDIDDFPS